MNFLIPRLPQKQWRTVIPPDVSLDFTEDLPPALDILLRNSQEATQTGGLVLR